MNTITVGINAHTNLINLIGDQPITLTKQLITVDDNLGGAIDTGDNISVYKNDDDIIRIYKVTKTGPDESDVDELVLVINISDSSLLVADDLNTRENISNLVYSIDESGLLTRKIDDDNDNTIAEYLRINYGQGLNCDPNMIMIYLIHEEQNYNINAISSALVSTDTGGPPPPPPPPPQSTLPSTENNCTKPDPSMFSFDAYNLGIPFPDTLALNETQILDCPNHYGGDITIKCNEVGAYNINGICTYNNRSSSESCVEPSDTTGYDYESNTFGITSILDRDRFNIIGLSCADGYEQDEQGPRGEVCVNADEPYKLRGCRPICNAPEQANYPEYNFENVSGTRSLRDVNNEEDNVNFNLTGLKCADGYHGDPKVLPCSLESLEWIPSGCAPYYDCECINGSATTSDTGGPICTSENEFNCATCDSGYTKDLTGKFCIPKCSCENGTEDTGCIVANEVKCRSCNPGYVKNTETNHCEKSNCLKHYKTISCEKEDKILYVYDKTTEEINCSGTECTFEECCTERSIDPMIKTIGFIILLIVVLFIVYLIVNNKSKPPIKLLEEAVEQ